MKFGEMIKAITAKRKFGSVDAATLKTAMMLAAVDGDVSADELASFRDMAKSCKGCNEKSFADLWDDALRGTGYLLIQSRILGQDELIALFVSEAEKQFVKELSMEIGAERERAFDFLEEMAKADGDFSETERKAIDALSARVNERREEIISMMYPRAKPYVLRNETKIGQTAAE